MAVTHTDKLAGSPIEDTHTYAVILLSATLRSLAFYEDEVLFADGGPHDLAAVRAWCDAKTALTTLRQHHADLEEHAREDAAERAS